MNLQKETLLLEKQKKDRTYILQNHQKQNQEVNYTVIPYLKKNFKRKINQFFLLPKEDTNQLIPVLKAAETKKQKAHQEEENLEKEERKKRKKIKYIFFSLKSSLLSQNIIFL